MPSVEFDVGAFEASREGYDQKATRLMAFYHQASNYPDSKRESMEAREDELQLLAEAPATSKSIPHQVSKWLALKDRFLFPDQDGSFFANPALYAVAKENFQTASIWQKIYENLESSCELTDYLNVLKANKEKAQQLMAIIDGAREWDTYTQANSELNRKKWLELIEQYESEIRVIEAFMANKRHAEEWVEMLSTTLASNSERGVYHSKRYPERVAHIDDNAVDANEKVKAGFTQHEQYRNWDIVANKPGGVFFRAAPENMMAVTVRYDNPRVGRREVHGKHVEFYQELSEAVDPNNPAVMRQYMVGLKIDTRPADPLARARQIVDMATRYYLNCQKIDGNHRVPQPEYPIGLSGENAQALKIAFIHLGVDPSRLIVSSEVKTPSVLLKMVESTAKQQKYEARQILRPPVAPNEGSTFGSWLKHKMSSLPVHMSDCFQDKVTVPWHQFQYGGARLPAGQAHVESVPPQNDFYQNLTEKTAKIHQAVLKDPVMRHAITDDLEADEMPSPERVPVVEHEAGLSVSPGH